MTTPDPKANTTTEAYLAYKAGYLEESELKPKLYEPYLHFDAWLAYWAGLTTDYPNKGLGKNLIPVSNFDANENRFYTVENFTLKAGTYTASFDLDSFSLGSNTNFEFRLALRDKGNVGHNIVLIKPDSSTTTGRKTYTFYIEYNTSTNTWPVLYIQETPYNNGARIKISNLQIEAGSTATSYEPYAKTPEMLTDEEALVAYLSGVTDTYPEDIKDPYDVRIVGYLKHLASTRWPEPDYPVNNEEFYLSTMEPTHTSNSEPSADIELDTASGKIISIEAYGDTKQQTYTGKNLLDIPDGYTGTSGGVTTTWSNNIATSNASSTTSTTCTLTSTLTFKSTTIPAGTYTFSVQSSTSQYYPILRLRDTSDTWHNYSITAGKNSVTITTDYSANAAQLSLGLWTAGTAITNFVTEYPMLEVGSSATSYEPYVGGVPSPSPDYPQTVNVVTGTQTVTVNGKNLFDRASAEENKLLAWATGLTLDETGSLVSDYIPVTPAEELKFTYNAQVLFYGASKNYIGALLQADGSAIAPIGSGGGNFNKITVPNLSDIAYMRLGFRAPYSSSVNLLTADIQVERGTVATAYEPYQGQSYTVDLAGDNLFDISKVISNSPSVINNGDGTLTVTAYGAYATSPNTLSAFCPTLQAGDEVVLIADTTSSNKFVYLAGSNTRWNFGEKRTILASDLTSGVLWYSNNASTPATISNIKVAKPIELCKIGDYQDYIYKSGNDWYVHKETGKTIVTGDSSEGWIAQTSNVGYMYRLAIQDVDSTLAANMSNLVSDYFTAIRGGAIYNVTSGGYIAQLTVPGYIRFNIGDTTNKLSEFRTWLGTHNTTVYYALATPTNTKITDSTLIGQLDALAGADTYDGKTYIKVTATNLNLPALLKVEAYKY